VQSFGTPKDAAGGGTGKDAAATERDPIGGAGKKGPLWHIARSNELKFQPIPAIGFVLPGDNLYANSSSLTYLVSAFFVA
jgi:hypothetical protein